VNLALLIVTLVLLCYLLSKLGTAADEQVTRSTVSVKNLRHYLRAECGAGVDLPTWRTPKELEIMRGDRP
jgi:predicted DNA-binding transcriptional regulator YafY